MAPIWPFDASVFPFAFPENFFTREVVVVVGASIIIGGLCGGVEDAVKMLMTFCAKDLAN